MVLFRNQMNYENMCCEVTTEPVLIRKWWNPDYASSSYATTPVLQWITVILACSLQKQYDKYPDYLISYTVFTQISHSLFHTTSHSKLEIWEAAIVSSPLTTDAGGVSRLATTALAQSRHVKHRAARNWTSTMRKTKFENQILAKLRGNVKSS